MPKPRMPGRVHVFAPRPVVCHPCGLFPGGILLALRYLRRQLYHRHRPRWRCPIATPPSIICEQRALTTFRCCLKCAYDRTGQAPVSFRRDPCQHRADLAACGAVESATRAAAWRLLVSRQAYGVLLSPGDFNCLKHPLVLDLVAVQPLAPIALRKG